MYVHIGKNYVIESKKIITILNLEDRKLEEIIKELNINKIEDISENNNKSLIVYKDKKEIKGYITNISSITLAKRIEKDII